MSMWFCKEAEMYTSCSCNMPCVSYRETMLMKPLFTFHGWIISSLLVGVTLFSLGWIFSWDAVSAYALLFLTVLGPLIHIRRP